MQKGRGGNRKATIKDVAQYAGVSTATVERALKNSGRIKEETRQRVLRAITCLDYEVNDVAQALQKNTTYTIHAIYHTVPEYFTEDFARGFAAAEANLKSRGLILNTIRTKSLAPRYAVEALQKIDLSNTDAIVIDCGGTELDEHIRKIVDAGIPVATFGSDSPSSKRDFYVGENPYISGQIAGEIAARYMGGRGRLTVFQGPTSVYALSQRTRGLLDVLKEEYPAIEVRPSVDHNDDDTLAVRGAIRALTGPDSPDGIFCNSAGGTIALHRAIQYLDFPREKIPMIIGYDLNSEIVQMLKQGNLCATFFQNPFLQAYNVLNYMFEFITRNVIPPNARKYMSSNLVFRYNADLFMGQADLPADHSERNGESID